MTEQKTKTKKPTSSEKASAKKPAAKKEAAKKSVVKKPVEKKAVAKKTPPKPPQTYAGFVAVIGAPNAGKSTLLNRLVGEKVSIISPKAQTTRSRIIGLMNEGTTQIAIIDTPGIFAAKSRLDKAMVEAAWQSLEDADAILWLVDAAARQDDRLDPIIAELRRRQLRVTMALNKTDKINRDKLLPLTQKLFDQGVVDDVFMISALTCDGLDDLKKFLIKKMPEGPWLYPEDQLSNLPNQLLCAELTREQIFRQLQQELPYAAAVLPENWEVKHDGSSVIHQTIVVSRMAHRAIVIGAGGSRIKALGEAARRDIEKLLGTRAHLFLQVKVDERWQERRSFYEMFGLEFK